jgi:hypothetical protein
MLERQELASLLALGQHQFSLCCLPGTASLAEVQVCLALSEDGSFPTDCSHVEEEAQMPLADNCPEKVQLVGHGDNLSHNYGRIFSSHLKQASAPLEL